VVECRAVTGARRTQLQGAHASVRLAFSAGRCLHYRCRGERTRSQQLDPPSLYVCERGRHRRFCAGRTRKLCAHLLFMAPAARVPLTRLVACVTVQPKEQPLGVHVVCKSLRPRASVAMGGAQVQQRQQSELVSSDCQRLRLWASPVHATRILPAAGQCLPHMGTQARTQATLHLRGGSQTWFRLTLATYFPLTVPFCLAHSPRSTYMNIPNGHQTVALGARNGAS